MRWLLIALLILATQGCGISNLWGLEAGKGAVREKKVEINFYDYPDRIDVRADCHWCGSSGNETISKKRKEDSR